MLRPPKAYIGEVNKPYKVVPTGQYLYSPNVMKQKSDGTVKFLLFGADRNWLYIPVKNAKGEYQDVLFFEDTGGGESYIHPATVAALGFPGGQTQFTLHGPAGDEVVTLNDSRISGSFKTDNVLHKKGNMLDIGLQCKSKPERWEGPNGPLKSWTPGEGPNGEPGELWPVAQGMTVNPGVSGVGGTGGFGGFGGFGGIQGGTSGAGGFGGQGGYPGFYGQQYGQVFGQQAPHFNQQQISGGNPFGGPGGFGGMSTSFPGAPGWHP